VILTAHVPLTLPRMDNYREVIITDLMANEKKKITNLIIN